MSGSLVPIPSSFRTEWSPARFAMPRRILDTDDPLGTLGCSKPLLVTAIRRSSQTCGP